MLPFQKVCLGQHVLCFMLCIFPAQAIAIGEAEKGDYSISAVGAVRLTGAYLQFPNVPEFYPDEHEGLGAGVARLLLDGYLGQYLDYDVNLFAEFSYMPGFARGGAFSTAGSFKTPYRTKYLSWDYVDKCSMDGQLGVDRFALNLEIDIVTLSMGRFPVNYSVTQIFTPNDFFAPFSPSAVNKIYKPGVDALQLGIRAGTLSLIELVAVMGYDDGGVPSWGQTGLLVRANTVLWNYEWAILGGKVAERWVVGASLQGEAGPFGLRAEGHAGFPDAGGDGSLDDIDGDGERIDDIHGRLAAGIDIMFTWHNVTLGAEYMFLSDGASHNSLYFDRMLRFFPDDIPYMGRHYVGLSAGGDIIPILRLQALTLFNVQDASGLGALFLLYNVTDEVDLMAGVLIPMGDGPIADSGPPDHKHSIESEFGLSPVMVFIESRIYF